MLEQAAEEANTGLSLTHFRANSLAYPQILDLRQTITVPETNAHQTPLVQWEFLSPYLPIIRVTTYAEHHLPFGPPVEREFSEQTFEYPEPLNHDQVAPTRYAVSFVVSLQQIWDRFDNPERIDFYRYGTDADPEAVVDELEPNQVPRWYATDFMQHRLIGPVVLQVFESDYFKTGIYSRMPNDRTWEKPSFANIQPSWMAASRPPRGIPRSNVATGDFSDYVDNIDKPDRWHFALSYGARQWQGIPSNAPPFPTELFHETTQTVVDRSIHGYCRKPGRDWARAECWALASAMLAKHGALHDVAFRGVVPPQ